MREHLYDTQGEFDGLSVVRSGAAFGSLSGSVDRYSCNARGETTGARRTKGGLPVRGFSEDFAYYDYAAFGAVVAQRWEFAEANPWRFSSEYADSDLGLVYYNYRHYEPLSGRWLQRDPIEEDGGNNLYCFCGNNPIMNYDKDGCAYFIKRSMFGIMYQTAQRDMDNQEWAHEQLIFEDGKTPSDVGFFDDNKVREDPGWKDSAVWVRVPGRFNDCVMRKAVEQVSPQKYKMRGDGHYNCQDYAEALRNKYNELIMDKRIRCECKLDETK